MKAEHIEKGTLTQEEERILDRYLLEYKHQGFELPANKYDELNANWMKRLYEEKSHYNFRMMVTTFCDLNNILLRTHFSPITIV